MNQQIYNLHRLLTEEGVECTVRTMVGTARLFSGDLMIAHSGSRNCFLIKPADGPLKRVKRAGVVLKLLKEKKAGE